MRPAIAAAALVVVADGLVLVSSSRERAEPATRTPIDVCAAYLSGGEKSEAPPALRLEFVRDSLGPLPGLDSTGLRALGFTEAAAVAVGRCAIPPSPCLRAVLAGCACVSATIQGGARYDRGDRLGR